MLNCILAGIGGFIGAVLRYLMSLAPIKNPAGFPVNTFIVNSLGALVIGIIAAFAAKSNNLDARLVLLLKVGICGGFTTFSTFSLETAQLFKSGSTAIALVYAILSVAVCIAAAFLPQAVIK